MVTEGHPSLQFHSGRAEVDVMRRDKREEQMHDLQITRTQQGSEIEIDSMPNTAPFSQRMPVNILSHLLALEPHGTGTKRYYLCFPKYIYSVYIAKKIQNVHFIKTKLNEWLKKPVMNMLGYISVKKRYITIFYDIYRPKILIVNYLFCLLSMI